MLNVLANVNNTPNFRPDRNPITYGTLPGGHRYAGGYGPNLQYYSGELDIHGTVLLATRQATPGKDVSLESYGLERGTPLAAYDLVANRKSDGSDPIGRIMCSINRGDHILISGATGTGKTTLMNSMAKRLSPKLRIITVQDTPEIHLDQPNHIHIVMSRNGETNQFTYKSVVDLVVRSTPDVVMAGEISTTNAATIWELMRSGHGSFMTTVHAESTNMAISTFMTRIAHTSPEEVRDREKVEDEMRRLLRVIQIVLEKNGNRRIVEVT
jgi:type IV secretion system protein VirB11